MSHTESVPAEGPPPADVSPPKAVTLLEAFRFWLKLGFISFGGPAGQIAIMHQELVERRRWLSERRFLHALNYCMLLPGPEAQQLATYIGWLMHRTWGGIVAGALFVLPSLLILILLSFLFILGGGPLVESTHGDLKYTAPLTAITAAVVGVIANLALFFGYHVLWPDGFAGHFDWVSALIAAAAAVALLRFKVGVIPVIGAGALAGLVANALLWLG